MSRKFILSLAAVATLAGAALVSNNADAMVRSGRGSISVLRPIGHPNGHGNHWRFHEHRHFVHWHHHIWVRPVGYVSGVDDRRAARSVHLPDQELHAGRHGGVPGSVHQGNGEHSGRRLIRPGASRAGARQLRRPDLSGLPEGQPGSGRDQEELSPSPIRWPPPRKRGRPNSHVLDPTRADEMAGQKG